MKSLFLLLSFICLANCSILERFEEWIKEFEIKFRDEHHYKGIFQIWKDNNKFIEETNSKNLTYTLGHNQFSGLTQEQFSTYMGFNRTPQPNTNRLVSSITKHKPASSLPASVDWLVNGAVTPVKDQGQCGSCWSFSTSGALEGAYYATHGKLLSFSEQQLVDCDTIRNGGKDHGCKGGLMDNAFSWIGSNGGLCIEYDYPYVSGVTQTGGTCLKTCSEITDSKVVDYVDVTPSSDDAMMSALVKQPVAIAIEADQKEFQLYKSGVFTGACGVNLDHGVLVVGYGTESDGDYYLVKNSWGTGWGSSGYIKLGRGKQYNNGDGQCGMLLEGSYPIL